MPDYTPADLARDRAAIANDIITVTSLGLYADDRWPIALDALEAAWKRIAYLERFADRSPSEVCRLYGVQNCHFCDDMECGDNTSVTHERIARLEAAWAEVEELRAENHRMASYISGLVESGAQMGKDGEKP